MNADQRAYLVRLMQVSDALATTWGLGLSMAAARVFTLSTAATGAKVDINALDGLMRLCVQVETISKTLSLPVGEATGYVLDLAATLEDIKAEPVAAPVTAPTKARVH